MSCSLIMWSWLILCSATADLSGCASLICLLCSLIRSWMDRHTSQQKRTCSTSRELLEINLCLATVLSKFDWSLIDHLMFNKATHVWGRQQGQTTPEICTAPQTQHPTTKTIKATVINLAARCWMTEYPRYYRKVLIML